MHENVAYSLRRRGTPRGEIDRRLATTAAELGIIELVDRWPDTLSGGQAQRVALARCSCGGPNASCSTSPLPASTPPSAMRCDKLSMPHSREPLTTLFVTHDQDETLALADRLVVIRAGRIEQVGTPQQVYDKPANRFVAGFLGSPPMNFFEGHIVADNGVWFEGADIRLPLADSMRVSLSKRIGKPVTLGVRPEHLTVSSASGTASEPSGLLAIVQDCEFRGADSIVRATTNAGATVRRFSTPRPHRLGVLRFAFLSIAIVRCTSPATKPAAIYCRSREAQNLALTKHMKLSILYCL